MLVLMYLSSFFSSLLMQYPLHLLIGVQLGILSSFVYNACFTFILLQSLLQAYSLVAFCDEILVSAFSFFFAHSLLLDVLWESQYTNFQVCFCIYCRKKKKKKETYIRTRTHSYWCRFLVNLCTMCIFIFLLWLEDYSPWIVPWQKLVLLWTLKS